MIRLYMALTILAGALFARYPAITYDSPPEVGVGCRDLFSPGPYQTLVQGKTPTFLSGGTAHELSPDHLYFVPPLGAGYLEYKRMGREIAYYAKPDEMYWNRESASYPVTDPEGRIILLISGDQTAVRLMDRNGNMASDVPLSGLLMTDYSFTNDWPVPGKEDETQPAAAVLFAGGPVYLILYGTAQQTIRLEIPSVSQFFAKSIALGRGKIAIHMSEGESDFVRLYSVKMRKEPPEVAGEMSARLPAFLPHRISLSLVEDGVLFSSAQIMGMVDQKGTLRWSASGQEAIHPGGDVESPSPAPPRTEFQGDSISSSSISVVGNGTHLVVTDNRGNPLVQSNRRVSPFRFLSPRSASGTEAGRGEVTIEDHHSYCTISSSPRK